MAGYSISIMVKSSAENNGGSQSGLLVLGKISSLLDAFSMHEPVLTLADLREATGLPASTVQRLAVNLAHQGFLDREGDAYRIGLRMAYWAAPATRGVEILDVIRPLLSQLRDRTGETACLFRSEQRYRVCIGIAETRHALRREMHLGKILPLHAGSAGHVLLAYEESLMREVLANPLEPITGATITDSDGLKEAVDRTRIDGFAITTGERESGASGLSAPVFDSSGDVVTALTISGPSLRMSREVCEGWVEVLLEKAEQMTRLVGGRFPSEAPY